MRTADRRPSKNVNDVPNGKLINTLTTNTWKEAAPFLPTKERCPFVCRDLFLRVLKLTKRPRMKYGKGTNKGMLKVRRLHSTD